ncbi:MAG TPA: alpha-L-arabinofuranosidase C-terminal domain-containing protein [Pelobium sp.]|nr:alpha-L-arabinofuranosidase C-terminal domain-containing protein [Pelobium sp.]
MKKNLFVIIIFCLGQLSSYAWANQPDSTYLFAYTKNDGKRHNGLQFAWSVDSKNWHSIGPEFIFVRSDYGTEKKMLMPVLLHDPSGVWHCLWKASDRNEVYGHTASDNLFTWGRQDYSIEKKVYENAAKQLSSIEINGEKLTGTKLSVSWHIVEELIKTRRSAAFKEMLRRETIRDDSTRLRHLKPVQAKININTDDKKPISNMLIGAFFEDINYSADGGLYAELIQNRGFEYNVNDKLGKDLNWNNKMAWELKGAQASWTIDSVAPIHPNNKHYAKLQLSKVGAALVNEGFDGIPIKKNDKYNFSVFARSSSAKNGIFLIRLVGIHGEIYGETQTKNISKNWKKYDAVLTATETASDARLEIYPQFSGTIDMDMICLFPQKTFKERANGLRADLAQTIAEMKPKFIRFPGGCLVHGFGIDNMYHWKNTIGPLEKRKPQRNIWNYHQTVGLGYYEYFQFCEDIGAEPLPVVAAGVPCQNSEGGQQGGIPLNEMDKYVQDVLDLIEWANGGTNTKWGKIRAESGHPKPFNLRYIGVGNEDQISDVFEKRFTMIFDAIRDKHPEITVIGTSGPFNEGTDYQEGWTLANKLKVPMVDEHYYQSPGWFINNQDFYDSYDRNSAKVYLGEYAAHAKGGPNIESALAEALYLASVERNGDIVKMSSYAPLLAKEGHTQWNPDLIYFNNTEVKPTTGYYVQRIYGQNSGDEYLANQINMEGQSEEVKKRFAVSTVYDSRSGDLIIKIINMLPVTVKPLLNFEGKEIQKNVSISKQVLTGKPENKTAVPTVTKCSVNELLSGEILPYSLTVYRFKL